MTTRRQFLSTTAATTLSLSLPALARTHQQPPLRFGIISDIHHDIMHDGIARLTSFIDAMRTEKPDFIVQLGDFCVPHARNQPFLDLWNQFNGPRYHIIGNHDTDGGFKRDQVVSFLGMTTRYHAWDAGAYRFIALDGNDPGGTTKGYPRHIANDQADWLDHQLASTTRPVIIMTHQPLDGIGGIDNQQSIRDILEKNRGSDHPGVAAVLSGHLHQDYVRIINQIAHIQINSASYVWLEKSKLMNVYPPEIHQSHPYLNHVAPYRDPLWAIITLDPSTSTLTLKGRSSTWVGPDPWSRGASEVDYPRAIQRPAISDWSAHTRA